MKIKALFLSIGILMAFSSAVSAQTTTSDTLTAIVGKWAGTYEGASAGKFELVLNQDSNRKLTGQVVMLPDDGNRYPIDLKTVVWQNGQLRATYIDPNEGDEVSFVGSYSSPALKGTWKSDEGQSTGTWQVSRLAK